MDQDLRSLSRPTMQEQFRLDIEEMKRSARAAMTPSMEALEAENKSLQTWYTSVFNMVLAAIDQYSNEKGELRIKRTTFHTKNLEDLIESYDDMATGEIVWRKRKK